MSLLALLHAALLTGLCAGLLHRQARRIGDRDANLLDGLAARIEQHLPHTQCGECGFDGCRPYAQALATGRVGIDRCPPGGSATLLALSRLTGQLPPEVLRANDRAPVARIDEEQCIGCVKCIHACPVDAIIGAAKQMHGVLPQYCTGCGLCLPPCPVDCIQLIPPPGGRHGEKGR